MKDRGSSDSDFFAPFKSLASGASSSQTERESGHGDFRKLNRAKKVKSIDANLSTMDEIKFALNGLRSDQTIRIRRTSLLSLLSSCGSIHRKRSLGSHGFAKTVIDAILGLTLDDPPSNLAAAALVYVLTVDDHADRILHSPSCIRFLIKLLKQHGKIQSSSIGNRILAVGNKGVDSISAAILQRVDEILDAKYSSNGNVYTVRKLEERTKWIALLTMEKACLSTMSTEDATIFGRKSGGNFKEKLCESGGLDAVFEIIQDCYSNLERWLKQYSSKNQDVKENADHESLLLLLKCFQVVENATIFSKNNQDHLLGLRSKAPESFIKFIINVINALSGLSLLKNSMDSENLNGPSAWITTDNKAERDGTMMTGRCSNIHSISISRKKFGLPESNRWLSARCSGKPKSTSDANEYGKSEPLEDCQDPFAFDDLEFKPTKWEGLSREQGVKKNQNGMKKHMHRRESASNQLKPAVSSSSAQLKLGNQENNHPVISSSSSFDEETHNLVVDCLLHAIKVLMNVTNENPLGCSQTAANGGLEILTSLLAHLFGDTSENISLNVEVGSKSNMFSADQKLNLLVAILGLLVNLVEKDSHNRLRLAEAVIPFPHTHGSVVALLCSIFMENKGAGEEAEEAKGADINWDDEEALLQGEKEAEKMIVEAYTALLLAFLSTQSTEIKNAIVKYLPHNNLAVLVPVLERFLEFHLMLNMISAEIHASILEVIESCRL